MSRFRTVGELTASVRLLGDYEDDSGGYEDSYISSAFVISAVDSAYAETYDTIVTVDPDRQLSTYEVTTAADTETYSLPSDLYRVRAVDMNTSSGSSDWYKIDRYELGERDYYAVRTVDAAVPDGGHVYRVEGSVIRLRPVPNAAKGLRIWYVPTAARLTSSLQSIDGINGFEELIVWRAVKYCKVRAQESTAEADGEIARQTDRVQKMAANRDRGAPRRLLDPRTVAAGRRWRRR